MIAAAPPPIVVCDTCAVTRLDDALRRVREGGTIIVRGRQVGNFSVRRSLTLTGESGAVLDGAGRGTVLTILAPNVTVRDLGIVRSGTDFVAMDAAIRSNARGTTIQHVSIGESLFGVYLARSDESIIEHSRIVGMLGRAVPDRGDAIRIWYSKNVRVVGNRIQHARDDLIWFSRNVTVADNVVTGGRYGIHTMYSDGMVVSGNEVRECEVGSYAMYGRHVRIEGNLFAGNRGSTGYGVGLKDMDDSRVTDNAFVSNHTGIYLDDSPSLVGSTLRIERNVIAYNEIGLAAMPSAHDDILVGNTFADNYRQVSVLGGGTLAHLAWSRNYWSDYAGFDRNRDGVGDIPYRLRSAYGKLSDLDPRLELLSYSPAASAVDFAANALPLFDQPATLEDAAPIMQPVFPRHLPQPARGDARMNSLLMGVLALTTAFGVLVPARSRWRRCPQLPRAASVDDVARSDAAIRVRALRKRYGKTLALDGVDLQIERGETVGLWGPNGSGKSTLLRCILRVVEFEGEISAMPTVGYVPQQLPQFDMSVRDFARFVGGLHGCDADAADGALRDAELLDMGAKNVGELSGGQRQRLGVAVASLGSPELLLLDEPTVGLDARSRGAILRLIAAQKRQGKTVIIASHVSDDLTTLADRIVVMEEGRIREILCPAQFAAFIGALQEARS